MKPEYMYYATFSAALTAGAEPSLSQKLAYQMAQLCKDGPDESCLDMDEPLNRWELGNNSDDRAAVDNTFELQCNFMSGKDKRFNPLHSVDLPEGANSYDVG
ncbi:hypothetical protein [Vibrio mexicanus]|uniref:hypothetical protein n=1 Tax=Vibrio mexicanus TaxID=1004326 RepID=UPI00063CBEC5|nr:hypothetical protein [Vibrio mexicanus]